VFASYIENAQRSGTLGCEGAIHRFADVRDPEFLNLVEEARREDCGGP
jgi:hypothetical protein